MSLLTLGGAQVSLLALDAHLREVKFLALAALQPLPHTHILPIRPQQRANPRLHIPAQLEPHIGPVLQLARNVRDLVFGALVRQLDDAAGVRRRGFLALLGFLGLGLGFGRRVDVVVLVPGGGGAGEDGVPDDGFGFGLAGFGGGVDCLEVEEDLLRVPVEESAEVCGGFRC